MKARATGEWRHNEGAQHVGMARVRVERHLRRRGADSPQRIDHRAIQLRSEVARLIEASPHAPPRMQRYGDDAIAALQYSRSRIADHAAERIRQGAAAFVLECVDDLPQRALI